MTNYSLDVMKDAPIGTCEMCMSTQDIDTQYFHLKDEDGREYKIPGYLYDMHDGVIYITLENIPHFAAWLRKQELFIPVEHDFFWLSSLVRKYEKEVDTNRYLIPWVKNNVIVQDDIISIPLDALTESREVSSKFGIDGVLKHVSNEHGYDIEKLELYPTEDSLVPKKDGVEYINIISEVKKNDTVQLTGWARDENDKTVGKVRIVLGAYPGFLHFHVNDQGHIHDISYEEK